MLSCQKIKRDMAAKEANRGAPRQSGRAWAMEEEPLASVPGPQQQQPVPQPPAAAVPPPPREAPTQGNGWGQLTDHRVTARIQRRVGLLPASLVARYWSCLWRWGQHRPLVWPSLTVGHRIVSLRNMLPVQLGFAGMSEFTWVFDWLMGSCGPVWG